MASRSQTPSGDSAQVSRSRTRRPAVKSAPETQPVEIPDDMRRQWIAEAAYFIAERRGFIAGSSESDWLEAEQDIERMLASPRH